MTASRAEEITTTRAETIRDVAPRVRRRRRRVRIDARRVQTSHNSVLTEWAVATLCAITGNIDRPGGLYHNPGILDIPKLIEKFSRR